VSALPLGLDLESARRELCRCDAQVVFNLVESVAGQDRLAHLAPALLETLAIPFTGCGAEAMLLSANKLLTKRLLGLHGLPTPEWLEPVGDSAASPALGARLIVKSAFEHGSVGLTDDAVFTLEDREAARQRLREVSRARGGLWFAERFVDGREFNLSLIEGDDGVAVLPAAEIRFTGFDDGKPRMVGYDAKWRPESFEYANTTVSFDFAAADGALLARLNELAVGCWRAFGLAGYARVDFRVDADGQPLVLEINTNPCLSPDAGFARAAAQAGTGYAALVQRLALAAASRR
jgi:D-alanine-D-alanine ligase